MMSTTEDRISFHSVVLKKTLLLFLEIVSESHCIRSLNKCFEIDLGLFLNPYRVCMCARGSKSRAIETNAKKITKLKLMSEIGVLRKCVLPFFYLEK